MKFEVSQPFESPQEKVSSLHARVKRDFLEMSHFFNLELPLEKGGLISTVEELLGVSIDESLRKQVVQGLLSTDSSIAMVASDPAQYLLHFFEDEKLTKDHPNKGLIRLITVFMRDIMRQIQSDSPKSFSLDYGNEVPLLINSNPDQPQKELVRPVRKSVVRVISDSSDTNESIIRVKSNSDDKKTTVITLPNGRRIASGNGVKTIKLPNGDRRILD